MRDDAGVGGLDRWAWRDIAGLNEFGGKVMHSAAWEDDGHGWAGKRVAVIGVVRREAPVLLALSARAGQQCDSDCARAAEARGAGGQLCSGQDLCADVRPAWT